MRAARARTPCAQRRRSILPTICAVLAACVSAMLGGAAGAANAAAVADARGWSGWWGQGDGPAHTFVSNPPHLVAAKQDEVARRAAGELVPGMYCRPPAFTGFNGGFVINFEFLVTPGRITIANEAGMIRRIYMDGRPLPPNPRPSNGGTSVGHWDGDTLVIETVGIAPDALVGSYGPIGRNAHITERIRLVRKDVLETDLVTIAPDLFAGPDHRVFLTGRVPGKREAIEISYCNEHDRSYDSSTGRERFDLTPPADLPPPPQG